MSYMGESRLATLVVLSASLAPTLLTAQSAACRPPDNSNEAKTLAIFSVPLAFGRAGIANAGGGRVKFGFELSYLPDVDEATATPTLCRPGKRPENTDLLFAAPRPRIAIILGRGFAMEASWVPPIDLHQVKANLVGVALSYDVRLNDHGTAVSLRAHGTFGVIKAPITCDDEALQDQPSECYQGTRSNDSYHPNIVGFDAAVRSSLGAPFQLYFGSGYNRLMPRFRVNFTNSQGQTDRQRIEVDLDRLALFGGFTWLAARRLGLSAEVYTAPADAVTGRVALRVAM